MSPTANRLNTRIFKLYHKNGETFKAHIKGCPWKSPFFRVKEVFDNCCATLQVLKPDYADTLVLDQVGSGSEMETMGNNTDWVFAPANVSQLTWIASVRFNVSDDVFVITSVNKG